MWTSKYLLKMSANMFDNFFADGPIWRMLCWRTDPNWVKLKACSNSLGMQMRWRSGLQRSFRWLWKSLIKILPTYRYIIRLDLFAELLVLKEKALKALNQNFIYRTSACIVCHRLWCATPILGFEPPLKKKSLRIMRIAISSSCLSFPGRRAPVHMFDLLVSGSLHPLTSIPR